LAKIGLQFKIGKVFPKNHNDMSNGGRDRPNIPKYSLKNLFYENIMEFSPSMRKYAPTDWANFTYDQKATIRIFLW